MATAPLSTLGKPTVELVGSDSNGLISFLNAGTTAVSASSKTNFSILKIYIYIFWQLKLTSAFLLLQEVVPVSTC